MQRNIKSMLFAILGTERTRAIARWIRGERPHFCEAELALAFFAARKSKGLMLDVGAHFGESFAPYLERGWRVFAFEPDPINRAKLRELVDVAQITLFECAVGDREQEAVPFFASEESSGISGLSAFRDTHREVDRVQLTTLKRLLTNHSIERVDFLKIDTEGHDLFVLKGFPWDRFEPDMVLCEFEDYKTTPLGYDYKAIGDFLVARGYMVFLSEWAPIVRYGVNHEWRSWRRYPCLLSDPKGWGNFVALRPGSDLTPIARYLRRFGIV